MITFGLMAIASISPNSPTWETRDKEEYSLTTAVTLLCKSMVLKFVLGKGGCDVLPEMW